MLDIDPVPEKKIIKEVMSMNREIRRVAKRMHLTLDQARSYYARACMYVAAAGDKPLDALRLARKYETGGVNVQAIIMIFIAIVIIYQLIPNISGANQMVQSSANASTMAKFAAGLGEWMFPLLGVVAVVFLLFKGNNGEGV